MNTQLLFRGTAIAMRRFRSTNRRINQPTTNYYTNSIALTVTTTCGTCFKSRLQFLSTQPYKPVEVTTASTSSRMHPPFDSTFPIRCTTTSNQQQQRRTSTWTWTQTETGRLFGLLVASLIGLITTTTVSIVDAAATSGGSGGDGKNKSKSPEWLVDRLCAAAGTGDLERLKSLFSQHQPREGVNITHRYGWTPLHVAVANDQREVVEWLLSQSGIDVNRPDRYGPWARNLDEVSIKHSARNSFFPEMYATQSANGMSPLHYAVLFASPEIVDMLIRAGADVNQEEGQGYTPANLIDWSIIPDESLGRDDEQARFLRAKKQRFQEIQTRLESAVKAREEERIKKEKEERLRFPLELKLKKEMIGQEVPILSVSAAIRRRDNGWFDPSKPLVFLFLGSSGVGKTMLAKLLSQNIVKDKENGFIRIDMSEYQAKHEMSRLIGSPPGYVGHEEGGQLTTKLAKCPDAVVLLDEVEKAHPDILSLMLQVFDEGRLTDGKGHTITCPRAIFIMTSNLVQDEIREALESGYVLRPQSSILEDLDKTTQTMRERGGITTTPLKPVEPPQQQQQSGSIQPSMNLSHVKSSTSESTTVSVPLPPTTSTLLPGSVPSSHPSTTLAAQLSKLATDTEQFLRFIVHPILKRAFKRDEFIGRINDMIIFHPFSHQDLEDTVTCELQRWAERAQKRHGIVIRWTPGLVDSLTQNYDERYGYRSIIYGVEKRVVNVLASAHERDRITSGQEVTLDIDPVAEHGQQPPVVIRQIKQVTPEAAVGNGTGKKKFFGLF